MKKPKKKARCPECGSSQVYFLKSGDIVCRQCGKRPEEKKVA